MQNVPSFFRIVLGGIMSLALVIYGLADFLLLPSRNHYQETERELNSLRYCR
jgi:hypothetical protein